MSLEGQLLDKKSLRVLKNGEYVALAKDCVAFANAQGGRVLNGIEDDSDLPPEDQKIKNEWLEKLPQRISQLTLNVTTVPQKTIASNGGEYIELRIMRNAQSIAGTSDGRYFLRVSLGLVKTKGKTKGKEYLVKPEMLRSFNFKGKTTLKTIENHRLRELILRDLEIYKVAGISDIHQRIGTEIPRRKVQYELKRMVENNEIKTEGEKRHRKYLWTKND